MAFVGCFTLGYQIDCLWLSWMLYSGTVTRLGVPVSEQLKGHHAEVTAWLRRHMVVPVH